MTRKAYEPQPGTIPHRVIAWLARHPVGERYASAVIGDDLDVPASAFRASMTPAEAAGLVKSSKKPGERTIYWELGDGKPVERTPIDDEHDDDDTGTDRKTATGSITGPNSVFALPLANGAPLKPKRTGNGVDMDAVHHRHDNVIEMEPAVAPQAGLDWKPPKLGDRGAVDAHEHFARTTIDQAAPLEVKPNTSTEPRCSVREYVKAIARTVPPDPPPPAPPAPLPRVRAGTAPYRFGIFNDGEFVQEKGGQRIVIDRDELEQLVRFIDRMREEPAA